MPWAGSAFLAAAIPSAVLFAATNVGTWWHAVALVAAPLIAVAIMAPVGRLAGVPRA